MYKEHNCISWRNLNPASFIEDLIYLEDFFLHPIKLNISLKHPQFDFKGDFVFAYIKNTIGKTFGNLDDVPVKLNGITLTSTYCTKDQAIHGLIERYEDISIDSVLSSSQLEYSETQ